MGGGGGSASHAVGGLSNARTLNSVVAAMTPAAPITLTASAAPAFPTFPLDHGVALMTDIRNLAITMAAINTFRPLHLYRGSRFWSESGTETGHIFSLAEQVQECFYIAAMMGHAVHQFPADDHILHVSMLVACFLPFFAVASIWYRKRHQHQHTVYSSSRAPAPQTPLSLNLESNGVPRGGIRAFLGAPGRPEAILAILHIGLFVLCVGLSAGGVTASDSRFDGGSGTDPDNNPHWFGFTVRGVVRHLEPQLIMLLGNLATFLLQLLWRRAEAQTGRHLHDADGEKLQLAKGKRKGRRGGDTSSSSSSSSSSSGSSGSSKTRESPSVAMRSVKQSAILAKILFAGVCTVTVWVPMQLLGSVDVSVLILILVPVIWVGLVLAVVHAVPEHVTPFVNPQHHRVSLRMMRRSIYVGGARLYPVVHASRALGTKLIFPSNAFTADAVFMLQEPSACVASFCVASGLVACICVHCGLSRIELFAQLGFMALVVFPLTCADAPIVAAVAFGHALMAVGFVVHQKRLVEEEEPERRIFERVGWCADTV